AETRVQGAPRCLRSGLHRPLPPRPAERVACRLLQRRGDDGGRDRGDVRACLADHHPPPAGARGGGVAQRREAGPHAHLPAREETAEARPGLAGSLFQKTLRRNRNMSEIPQFFRLNVEVADLEEAIRFYTKLLGFQGRKQPGSRVYYECGPVTLQVVQIAQPHTAAKALYFTVSDLEAIFER